MSTSERFTADGHLKPLPFKFDWHGPDVVCNCHDCTQARSLLGKAWLIEILDRIEREIKGTNTGMFKTYDAVARTGARLDRMDTRMGEIILGCSQFYGDLADRLARIEQSQATLAGALCPPRRGKVHGDRHKRVLVRSNRKEK